MKQVVALLGSKRRKNTYGILEQIKPILEEHGAELRVIPLCDCAIRPCAGCEACILHGRCILQGDDTADIMDQLQKADGIILASPVYLRQVSGQLKTFLDRTCVWYHRPPLAGKPLLAVATTKGSGLGKTLAYLESMGAQWGAVPAGKIGRSIFDQDKPVGEKELKKFLGLLEYPNQYAPGLGQLMEFQVQKAMALSLNRLDRKYWEEKGWREAAYFYPCKVNPFYGFISVGAGKILQQIMEKNKKPL